METQVFFLPDEMWIEILLRCDPLGRLLFGLASTMNKCLRKRTLQKGQFYGRGLTGVWTLFDIYGTIDLFKWSLNYWPGRKEKNACTMHTGEALDHGRFDIAHWMVTEGDGFRLDNSSFNRFWKRGDYEGMTWCIEHKQPIPCELFQQAWKQPDTDPLPQWLALTCRLSDRKEWQRLAARKSLRGEGNFIGMRHYDPYVAFHATEDVKLTRKK